jgi:thymidylate synthase (FAD)
MNIVTPYAKINMLFGRQVNFGDSAATEHTKQAGIEALRYIEWCGRISHRSEDAQTGDSYKRFIQSVVIDHGDWSIVEHVSASVDFLVDRGITHELVRHRLCAFTQESTRFVNYEKKMPPSFIIPEGVTYEEEDAIRIRQDWTLAIQQAEMSYRNLLVVGCSPQIARSVFPNALASRIVVTTNLRNWRHILIMRTTKEAHPQMREVMIPLLEQFQMTVPILFDDIEAMNKQSEAMRTGR